MKTLAEKIKVMQAALDGKPIQILRFREIFWSDIENPIFDWEESDYRIKPGSKVVPLKMSDIPPLCWLSFSPMGTTKWLVNGIENANDHARFQYCSNGELHMVSLIELAANHFYYSSDGINFKPCSKTIAE